MTLSNRPLEIAAFLDRSGWGKAEMQPLAGDFSTRRYARLVQADGNTAILMDEEKGENCSSFVTIGALLRQSGVTAPEIYAADADKGLLLLRDFGSRNIGALIDASEEARGFFLRAGETLATLHKNFDISSAGNLPIYNAALFTSQAELFLDFYFPHALQHEASAEEREEFRATWETILHPLDRMPQSLMLRDFMPDNLMDLGKDEIGVLDFQDAGIGPVAYDLASLCEEVRRDGGFDLLPDVIRHYREKSGATLSENDLARACIILSAQRHTRILGIIARLAMREGRKEKLVHLPRILKHLKEVLQQPYLLPVRVWMENNQICP